MLTPNVPHSPDYFRVGWQCALAAGVCLGLPAGLVLWLILLQHILHSSVIGRLVTLLQLNGLISIFLLALSSLLWSFFLARISGYRPWWKIGLATVVAILVGWFSPLSNLDGVFAERLPMHQLYAVAMCGIIGAATLCVGLAYGLLLRNLKAGILMALTTGVIAILTLLLTVALFDQFGIRVGMGNFAMSKVTVAGLLTSAIAGGAVLGIGFSRAVHSNG
jgi:hypothetical protein